MVVVQTAGRRWFGRRCAGRRWVTDLSLYGPVETLERGVLSARFRLITVLHVPLNLPNIWVVFTCFAFSLIVHLFLSLWGYLH